MKDQETTTSAIVKLSRRETEILRLMVLGFTTKQIALNLGVSMKRVRNVKYSFRKKMALPKEPVPALITAIARAAQHGLVDETKTE